MPEVGKYYSYRYDPDYKIFVHAVFSTKVHNLYTMIYEDMDGMIFDEEIYDFGWVWRVVSGY